MLRLPIVIVICAAMSLSLSQFVGAGVVISFDPAVTNVEIPLVGATSFTIDVRLRASSGTEAIVGYDIPVDLTPVEGRGLPVGWSIGGFAKLKDFGSELFFPGELALTPEEGDFLVGDASVGAALDFDTNPTSLFSFTVNVASTAETGTFNARVVDGALLAITGFARDQITIENFATITTTAVPEPSGLAVLCSALGCVFFRRRAVLQAVTVAH